MTDATGHRFLLGEPIHAGAPRCVRCGVRAGTVQAKSECRVSQAPPPVVKRSKARPAPSPLLVDILLDQSHEWGSTSRRAQFCMRCGATARDRGYEPCPEAPRRKS